MPEVSIITPVYNSASFLTETIESVQAQQNCSDWELILIDDGSTDSSVSIAAGHCSRDRRILLLTHESNRNGGSSASRNLGIAHSRAPLIAFLDSDDTWFPNRLRAQIDLLNQHPEAAMIYSAAERWYSWSPSATAQNYTVPAYIPGYGTDTLIPPPALLRAYLTDESATPCTCTAIVRRESVLRAGAFENSFTDLYDDQVFYAKICLREPVYVSSACTARYRQHDGSCCATARRLDTAMRGRARFLNWLRNYTKNDKSVFEAVRKTSA